MGNNSSAPYDDTTRDISDPTARIEARMKLVGAEIYLNAFFTSTGERRGFAVPPDFAHMRALQSYFENLSFCAFSADSPQIFVSNTHTEPCDVATPQQVNDFLSEHYTPTELSNDFEVRDDKMQYRITVSAIIASDPDAPYVLSTFMRQTKGCANDMEKLVRRMNDRLSQRPVIAPTPAPEAPEKDKADKDETGETDEKDEKDEKDETGETGEKDEKDAKAPNGASPESGCKWEGDLIDRVSLTITPIYTYAYLFAALQIDNHDFTAGEKAVVLDLIRATVGEEGLGDATAIDFSNKLHRGLLLSLLLEAHSSESRAQTMSHLFVTTTKRGGGRRKR